MNKKGFTFIEVIIIFTIIFIMTAVLMSTSYKGRATKELQATAREVTASIREAQNNALTGKNKGMNTLPCAFQFVIGGSSYQIMHETRDIDGDCRGSFDPFFDNVPLPKNTTMSARASDSKRSTGSGYADINVINFEVPYGKIIMPTSDGLPNDGTEIILVQDDKHYHLCVHSTGLIEDYGITGDATEVCIF